MTQIKMISGQNSEEMETLANNWLAEREGQFIGIPDVQVLNGGLLITYRSKTNLSAPRAYQPGQAANPYLSADGKVQVPKM